jgi:hypothetical protein
VRKIVTPGSTNSLWKAVKAAMDVPRTLFEKGVRVSKNSVQDRFATFFDTKIKRLLDEVTIGENI